MDLKTLVANISEFEKKINYVYRDKMNAIRALTHSSYANEKKKEQLQSNERLEFLGDSILGFVFASKLFADYPDMGEGDMTRIRALIVCEKSLSSCSNNIELGRFMLFGKGEEQTGGRCRPSILADAFEAVIGSIYVDGGLEPAKNFILNNLNDIYRLAVKGKLFSDYKTELQEQLQKKKNVLIKYDIVREFGPDHNKNFVAQVKVDGKLFGQGQGKTKKEAEQQAAKEALLFNKKELK